jgi:type I restriction/modification specificity protein
MNNAKNTTLSPYLERLLDGEDVEWKTLGEVCDILRGKRLTKKELSEEGKYAVFHGGLVPIGFYSESNRKGDTTMVINVGASAGTIGYSRDDFWSSDGCFCISPSPFLLSRFIFYVLQSKDFQIKGKVRIAGIPTLDSNVLEQFPIPIPPLRVQARIVEILDKFTQLEAQLEAELQAELEARKKQYAYYRDQLLNFSQYHPLNVNIEWRTLGEVAELIRGNGLSKKDFSEFGIPAIHYGQIYTYYGNETEETLSFVSPETAKKLQKVYPGNIVITNTSENIEDVCKSVLYSGNVEAVTGGHATIIRPKDYILSKYLVYYTLTLDFFTQKKRLAKGTKVIDVSAKDLAKIVIPLPPLSEQHRIVDILDRFDTLINSISEGLPKEIALRRKQYEYYRDALLSFPRPEVSA